MRPTGVREACGSPRLKRSIPFIGVLGSLCFAAATARAQEQSSVVDTPPITIDRSTYLSLRSETEALLQREVLNVWFPRCIDNEHGGFHANFTRDWKPFGNPSKFSVFQGRMTWIAGQIALREPELKETFLPVAKHGTEFLASTLWDKQYGGFYWGLDEQGSVSPYYTDGKHLYGMSFAIYGLASAYVATHDPLALDYAQRGFHWIEQHAHDAKNGGYFEWLSRDGKPFVSDPSRGTASKMPVSGFPIGYKSMNTHIHLLEAYTQLYEVWKDDQLRVRIEELLMLVRDKISVEPGAMNLYFTNGWQAFPDHDSYGHDVEAAYLMLEAEDVLGKGHAAQTERMARMLVDHALHYGWDQVHGGFYQEGTTTGPAEIKSKEWWVQFEGLNALLLMHERYGRETSRYFGAYRKQWEFIKNDQVDRKYHGVFELVKENGKPIPGPKGQNWKAAYHDGRALLNVSDRLQRLAERGVE